MRALVAGIHAQIIPVATSMLDQIAVSALSPVHAMSVLHTSILLENVHVKSSEVETTYKLCSLNTLTRHTLF